MLHISRGSHDISELYSETVVPDASLGSRSPNAPCSTTPWLSAIAIQIFDVRLHNSYSAREMYDISPALKATSEDRA